MNLRNTMAMSAAAALATAAFPAAAQVSWYAAAGGGQARTNVEYVRSVEGGFANPFKLQTAFDSRDTAWKLAGGLRLTPHVALEVAYADLGRISTRTDGVVGNFLNAYRVDIDRNVHGVGLDLVGTLPVASRFDVLGRAGVYRMNVRTNIRLSDAIEFSATPGLQERTDEGKEDIVHVGLGLQARLTPRWAVRAEVERFMGVGNGFRLGDPNGTGRADVDLASVGVVFSF